VYCSAAYGGGAGTVRITSSGSNSLPIKSGGHVCQHEPLGNTGAQQRIPVRHLRPARSRCDVPLHRFATGIEQWRQSGVGTGGGVLSVVGHVLVLAEDGNLLLVKPDPAAYTEVARYRALDDRPIPFQES